MRACVWATGGEGSQVLTVLLVRPFITHPRKKIPLFLSKWFPMMANSSFLDYPMWLKNALSYIAYLSQTSTCLGQFLFIKTARALFSQWKEEEDTIEL